MTHRKPILLHTAALKVLIAGGGKVGSRKVKKYLSEGAEVHLVDTDKAVATPFLEDERFHFHLGATQELQTAHRDVFQKAHLVIVATSDADANAALEHLCLEAGKLYNRVDAPESGLFSDMHYHNATDYTVATSGASKSPYIAQYLLEQIKKHLGAAPVAKRIRCLAKATPILKKRRLKGDEVAKLADDTLERMYQYEDH